MKGKNNYIILAILTIVNLIFASSLDLYADEAYYWMYSQFPDWGYFDHPPAVGIVIMVGYALFSSELGVRLLFVLATSLTFYAMYVLVKPKNDKIFWLVSLSFFPLHLMGFMALPDVLIFLFSVLFMLSYKAYLQDQGIKNSFLVAITIAAMIYSKYHGLILVFFIVISNFKLLAKPSFYLIVAISLIMLFPHILWQVNHDFASLRYHFIDRSSGFKINHVLDYLLGFFFYNGPLVFIALLLGIVPLRTKDTFDRGMKFLLYGFFLFFLFSSLKGRVEANWTFFVILPALYLGFKTPIVEKKILVQLSVVTIVLITVFRIYILFPFGNLKGNRAMEFHRHQAFADSVKVASQGLPIIASRYQIASVLSFYLKEHIPSVNLSSRKNQFDFWSFSDKMVNGPYAEVNWNKTKSVTPKDSVDHLFLGKHYITLKDSFQLVRYPEIIIDERIKLENIFEIRYHVKAENEIHSLKPLRMVFELSNDADKINKETIISPQTINKKTSLSQVLEWPYGSKPTSLRISMRNPEGLDWKTKAIDLL